MNKVLQVARVVSNAALMRPVSLIQGTCKAPCDNRRADDIQTRATCTQRAKTLEYVAVSGDPTSELQAAWEMSDNPISPSRPDLASASRRHTLIDQRQGRPTLIPKYLKRFLPSPFISRSHLYIGGYKAFDLKAGHIRRVVPDFALIGAGKSGTTSLYNALDLHPDIFMSKPWKEPEFFCSLRRIDERYKGRIATRGRLLSAYMLKGYSGEKLIGDASTGYTRAGANGACPTPQIMHDINPDIRLIYLLRSPHVRLVSHIRQDIKRGRYEGRPLETCMADRMGGYLNQSHYHFQIEQYLQYFPADRLHIVIFEELINAPSEQLSKIFSFLGLPGMEHETIQIPRFNISPIDKRVEEDIYQRDFMAKTSPVIRQDVERLETFLGRRIESWD